MTISCETISYEVIVSTCWKTIMERCLTWFFRLGYSDQSGPRQALIATTGCSLLHMDSSHICLPDGAAADGMLCLLQHPSVLSVNCLLILLWCWLYCAVMNIFIQIVSLFAIFCFTIISTLCWKGGAEYSEEGSGDIGICAWKKPSPASQYFWR